MLTNITFGKYYARDSIVHKLNPLFKIISLIIMIVAIFFINSYKDIIMLTSYLILMIVYSDIDIITYLKNIYSIKIFLLFILIIDLIFGSNINNIIFDLYKLIFIIIYSSALTYTTSTSEITYGIERLLKPFNNTIPVNDIAMIITLTLRYIPTLTMESDRIIKAQKMRGINFDSKNIKTKISSLVGVFIPMFILSLKKSESTADIMDIRLYNYGKSRTNLRTNTWKKIDTLLLILNILILIIVIFY
ncbi:MAG: energy-coupling factor transporter transmembrane component T family protein [Bacilli bacterium]